MQNLMYDALIVGSGVSASFIAQELAQAGTRLLILEAGKSFNKQTYLQHELDANAQMYWGGGIEFNTHNSIGLLRPKVAGGGSIVNQALVDRFDDLALDSWREVSGVDFFNTSSMQAWYEKAEANLQIQSISETHWNGNARIFKNGFEKNNFNWAPLRRAQSNCLHEQDNDCIECLSGCPIDSKQSTPVTTLKRALAAGAELHTQMEVIKIEKMMDGYQVHCIDANEQHHAYLTKKLILGAGAIGNSKLLLQSGFGKKLPALGHNFYTHPQFMVLALYKNEIFSYKGPLQSLKSNDSTFRRKGFKLENVFAPPIAIAMLLPQLREDHQYYMRNINKLACIEVAIRDTQPGTIQVTRKGQLKIFKKLNKEDEHRRDQGLIAIEQIFNSTGAREVIRGKIPIGLHLMGGCAIGTAQKNSVVNPEFEVHGYKNLFIADSSIFPNAPGINPSLTIMALSLLASQHILKGAA